MIGYPATRDQSRTSVAIWVEPPRTKKRADSGGLGANSPASQSRPSEAGYHPPFRHTQPCHLGSCSITPGCQETPKKDDTRSCTTTASSSGALSACPSANPQVRRRREIGRVKFRDRDRWQELINFRGHPRNHRLVDHSGPFWEATDGRRTVDGRRAWPAEYEEPVNSGRSADGR